MSAVDWANLEVATAFVAGGVLGALATIRILRAVLQTYGRYGPSGDAKEPPPRPRKGPGRGL